MAKTESILAIDIGGDSLKVAEFSFPEGESIVLDNFAFAEYGGDLKEEDLMISLSEALQKTVIDKKFKAKKVYLSISGQSAFIRFSKLPPVGDDEGRISQLVEYEAKQHMPFSMDKVVWDYQLVGGDDENDGDEVGVMFVAIKEEFISKITDIVQACKKTVVCVETAPTACYNCCCANQIGKDNCEMILNIGGRCSTLVFVDNGKYFVRSIPIAGHSITQQISREFNIPFAEAEEMKRRHGFVALGGAYEEPDSEVAATISKIVRNVMTRLHGEVNRSINVYRSQWKGRRPGKIYLAGGSSVMAFTPRFFSEKLRTEVDYLNPFQIIALGKSVNKDELIEVAHMFSEVIGLGLRYVARCPIEVSLKPKSLQNQQNIREKIPYFYGSCASIVLCLIFILGTVNLLKDQDKDKVSEAETAIAATKRLGGDVSRANSTLSGLETEYDQIMGKINKRGVWLKIINELQNIVPDNMWLVSIKGIGSVAVEQQPSGPRGRRGSRGGDGGLFGGFGGPPAEAQKSSKEKIQVEWLKIVGHSLVMEGQPSLEEELKQKLLASPLFTDLPEEIRTVDFVPARGKDNLTSFTMEIKLKEKVSN
jgi:type IV pilus assembly protein PilM